MSTSNESTTKKKHRINVILTDKQLQALLDYANSKELTMSQALRNVIQEFLIDK